MSLNDETPKFMQGVMTNAAQSGDAIAAETLLDIAIQQAAGVADRIGVQATWLEGLVDRLLGATPRNGPEEPDRPGGKVHDLGYELNRADTNIGRVAEAMSQLESVL